MKNYSNQPTVQKGSETRKKILRRISLDEMGEGKEILGRERKEKRRSEQSTLKAIVMVSL